MRIPAADRGGADRRRTLAAIGGACLILQLSAAAFLPRTLETPNASTAIARALANTGRFVDPPTGKVAFHLPGEALLLAAAFRFLPASTWPYVHVPVTLLLVTCVADVAFAVGGPALALSAGAITALEPFVVAHGRVWDDTFLAAALEWLVFAILLRCLARPQSTSAFIWIAAAACAAGAALTRAQSQFELALAGAAAIVLSSLRPIRLLGCAVIAGVVIGLGAWGARNVVALGHFFIGSTNDGKTFNDSTSARVRATIIDFGQVIGASQDFVEAGDEVEVDRRFSRLAWTYISTHPVEFIKTAAFKIAVSLLGIDPSRPVAAPRNVVALGSSILLLIAGTSGLWWLCRRALRAPVQTLLAALVVANVVITLGLLAVGPIGLRYRLNLTMFLCLGTGATVVRLRPRLTLR